MKSAVLISTLLAVLLLPGVAQAWYVDISITGAGRVYETTDANELDEHCPDSIEGFASPSNTPSGTLGATCRAGDAGGDYQWGWTVRYVAEAAPGYRFDRWASDGRTNPGPVLCDGSSGSPTHTGAACQFATFANLQVRAHFVDDTNPQMSSLTGPNRVVDGPATFTFSAGADPTFRLFECRVGGVHEWQTCSSGRQENPAASGSYTFQVRAVDWSGNRSAESTWTWTVDKTPPETSLVAGPSGVVTSAAAEFQFNSNESGTFQCQLDSDAVISPCTSPRRFTVSDGPHTFKVWARDAAGNLDPTPATRAWTVDTQAPDTTLAPSGPSGATSATSATFSFGATGDAAAYACHLTGHPVDTNCASPRSYTGLPDGTYTFTVTARDGAGNADPSPATRTFTVDTQAPDTTLAPSGPSGSTEATTATFGFGSPEPGSTFTCRLDGAAPAACTSPRAYTGLAPGTHTFTVTARDAAGNVDATPAARTWTITAPVGTSPGTLPPPTPPAGGGAPSADPDPPPIVDAPFFAPVAKARYRVAGARTRVRSLVVKNVPADAKVLVTCKTTRKGCPFRKRAVKHSGGTVRLNKRLKGRRLRSGAVLQVRITSALGDVRLARWKIRRGRKPKLTLRCAPPGGRLGRCA